MQTRLVLRLLQSLQIGELRLALPDGSERTFSGQRQAGCQDCRADITIHDTGTFSAVLSRGDIGFGEAYMQGLWSTTDLSALLKLLLANRDAVAQVIYGRWWATLIDQIRHLLRFNRKSQARKNISAHYDLGNDFYNCWLDPTMSYSSALFDGTGCWASPVDLQEGQLRKIDRAISEMRPERFGPDAHVLEIGCGWGGLGRRLLESTCADYSGLTLSQEQKRWADQVLKAHGGQRFDVRLQDYRDEQGRYDGIVSIEMFEAVGERYWDAYFAMLSRCLKSDGIAVIQTITIDERLFSRYRRGTDFIQQYIFPGGMLPSATEFQQRAQAQGLVVTKTFAFGQDYARTLAEWAKAFEQQKSTIDALGFDERFQRMWRFYLAYCEAGFAQGDINVMQFTLQHSS
ncbi:MAG: class I SAM-dependent methyltransferase [Burkholderiaceae bacterium]|nr:class I SAM-dependent methyltransferase [Burkholderiaceae bacterium]